MSYILSALKKAERYRQAEATPNVFSVHVESKETDFSWKWLPATLSIVAVIAVSALTTLLISNWALLGRITIVDQAPQAVSTPAPANVAAQTDSPQATQATQASSDASQAAASAEGTLSPVLNADTQPGAQTASSDTPQELATLTDGLVDINALDPSIRSQLPRFTISGYLYSATRPQANKVIINDVPLREGQYVSDDLQLKEINARYIVMDYRGTAFRIDHDRLSDY